ncbi:hypothetical protein IGS61_09550 [Janthinobacterium sp. FW305-129]|uniref:M12 family metallopeptidase n=1 Tax=Janthinobacterium sp. FW305-129 TaxID=2775054 RepID=UPI001E59F113|nr:M12 family metallopeptidase [Janthinobacterium sp. FW305-129]MCC7597730.1 hypothetical protein [Janthinobacterium sp. FW305-129]
MPANKQYYCSCFTSKDIDPKQREVLEHQTKGVLLRDAKWPDHSVITIRFLEGNAELQERVRQVANEWDKLANLTFSFVQHGPSDVRIAFQQGNGSWSYMGTMCRSIPEPKPTMNFGWLTTGSSDEEVRSVVLHEFGHLLGLTHEHMNPRDGGIKWNRDAVIRDLSGPPNNWDMDTIERNMFQKYTLDQVVATKLDRDSIMMYPIPLAWTEDGTSVGFNSRLSEQDKKFIRDTYR